jgi:alcohol dehydrogenase class IV
MAKLIGICAAGHGSHRELLTGDIPIQNKGTPLVAIPTTAGTGSEATHFAVVYIDGQKYSIAHAHVLPNYAIIDPDLTAKLPASITAHTGLDALAQAVESLWSVHATQQSRIFASEALTRVLNSLEKAVLHPTPDVRFDMCRAAHLAGKAINISKTTAPHAISYTLTSQFGVPHGLAVALTLGAILIYNNGVTDGDCWHPKGVAQVRKDLDYINELIGVDDPADARKRIDHLIGTIGCATRLRQVGVDTEADLETIVQNVNTERLKNNPRALSQYTLRRLLDDIC